MERASLVMAEPDAALLGDLPDLLFSGVAERPMWGGFLAALATRLGAAAAGFVIAFDRPHPQNAAVLVPEGADGGQLLEDHGAESLFPLPPEQPTRLFGGRLAVRFSLAPGQSAWLVVVPGTAAGIGDEGHAMVAALTPLLSRVLPLYVVIGDSERRRLVAEHVLETSGVGVMLVDAAGRLVLINPVAQAIIDHGDVLTIQDGRLVARRAADQRELARFIREMADKQQPRRAREGHAALALVRDADTIPVTVMVRPGPPFGPVSAPLRRTATLILRDPARRIGLVSSDLIQLFQLTPAEARLACLLGDGASLDESALQLGVSRNTARSQLQAIFAKTGTNRQGDLVRLLLTSIASNAQPPAEA